MHVFFAKNDFFQKNMKSLNKMDDSFAVRTIWEDNNTRIMRLSAIERKLYPCL